MQPGVFLDRDGVLNPNVLNPETGMYESPHTVADFSLFPFVLDCCHRLKSMGFQLFLVSNQPSYAKGKTLLENLREIHDTFHQRLLDSDIRFCEYYYCFHHPEGVVAEYSGPCQCRKPSAFFLLKAQQEHAVDLSQSWIIGDRDTDIEMGTGLDIRTILIRADQPGAKQGASSHDFKAADLIEAVSIIHAAITVSEKEGDHRGTW